MTQSIPTTRLVGSELDVDGDELGMEKYAPWRPSSIDFSVPPSSASSLPNQERLISLDFDHERTWNELA